MTEAIIITGIIVGGIVSAFWLVVHYAFAAWKVERILAGVDDSQPLAI